MIWIISALLLFLGFSMAMTPYITQRGIIFGVTLSKETDEIIQLKKRYFNQNMLLSIVMILLFIYFDKGLNLSEEKLSIIMVVFISLQMVFGIVAYFIANRQVACYKNKLIEEGYKPNQKMVLDLNYRETMTIFPTGLLVSIQLIIIAIEIIITIKNQAIIPDKIIMQWDFQGNPTRIVDKTWFNIYSLPIIQLVMVFILSFTNESYKRGKQRVMNKQSVKWSQSFRKISSYIGVVIAILAQIMMFSIQMTSVVPFLTEKTMSKIVFILLGLMFLTIISLMVIYGQSGSRLNPSSVTPQAYDDDKYWKWGMFYFNREDPSFWVEKRMGIGMTINLANWKAVAFVVIPIVFILGVSFFIS
ncbi:DUF1648 domain-containing protein [Vagococcus luciliae]|uniref:DUF5808 domain-containing protein n=1 Tax=Vagococcus luciliae TaxID=2920380 RepID=A0ABY5P0D8_9ENTE|nr:DUF5808 domain-containing protein [Vagococcus luciliae]UUV99391.1 hypothetical protein G314FT_15520 [Vagococcus luciliae]